MNALEFIDYCRTIAAQTASEPSQQPILDAQMAIQFLLPPIMREAVRRVARKPQALQSLIRPHFFTVQRGFVYLAASNDDLFTGASGLEEEFAKSFQVGIVPETLNRTITSVSKSAATDNLVSQVPDFTESDEGRRLIVIVNGAEVLNAIIGAYVSASAVTLESYETGSIATVITTGADALIYDAPSQVEGEFTPQSLGLFSLVEQYSEYQAETAPLLPIFNVSGGKIWVKTSSGIDDGTIIVVYGISVPQILDETTPIDASDDVIDTALIIAASLMRGEMPVGYLGIPDSVLPPKQVKK